MSDSYSFRSTSSDQPAEVDIWDVIAQKVDLLVEAWDQFAETGRSPDLAILMEDVHVAQRRSVLTELIKIDLEYRWQQVQQPERLEFYIAKFAEFAGGRDLPVDLIYEEIQIRLQAGDQIEFAELRQRFPKQAEALQCLVGSIQVPPNDAGADSSDRPSKIVVPDEDSAAKYSRTAADDTLPLATGTGKRTLHELVPGDSLEDFDLLLELGAGSFAKVFLARQRSLERLVALKISKDSGSEPRTLAQMDHPNIVRVFDQRVCAQPPVRLLYMELVPGGTLHDVVRRLGEVEAAERTGRLMLDVVDLNLASSGIAPPEGSDIRRRLARTNWYQAVCEIGLRLAQGLAYAHEKGVLHRDIKPANVLLTPECSPKLADFNISFQDGREDEQAEDAFGGSIAYMSPEQLEACHPALGGSPHKVREASDIYSVGIMLYELTSGKRPFADLPSDQRWSLMLQRMIDQRRAVDFDQLDATLPGDCPLSLRTVLKKCLQSAENLRYRSAQQLANALKLCLHPRLWNLLRDRPVGSGRLRRCVFPVFTIRGADANPEHSGGGFNFSTTSTRLSKNWVMPNRCS
ncbi:MAG: serine/threonine-protein kinase [Pirellulaceae bacterium]